jgi:hypothetical protein
VLRGGGLGSREVTDLARHLEVDAAHAAFVLECAAAARLVAPDTSGALLPTLSARRRTPPVRQVCVAQSCSSLPAQRQAPWWTWIS